MSFFGLNVVACSGLAATHLDGARLRIVCMRKSWIKRALSGVTSALAALGVGELVALAVPGISSPLTVVGAFVVDIVPPWAKDFAIETFGTNDKLALMVGLGVVVLLVAALAGLLERPRRPLGSIKITVFGLAGAIAAAARANSSWLAVLPSLLGALVGILVLQMLSRKVSGTKLSIGLLDRRSFLQLVTASAVIAVAAGALGRIAKQASPSVIDFVLPTPKNREIIPEGADLKIPGLSPLCHSEL
ncbi:hypothetical protein [Renibacterium salmoninarum]|nr:hypothetical protein [Renibacterium salmoninarum]